jgi:threonine dehydrogenase-like Zn-dependent dehydrogenase
MRQAKFSGGNLIAIVDGPDPETGPGEVLVEVERCALCGSDFKVYKNGWPRTPGHEVTGIVRQPGHRLDGRRVAVYIPVWCGACDQCKRGNTHICETHRVLVGWGTPGGYAERLAVPEQCLLPISDDVPSDLAPLLLDAIGTTAHGIRLAKRVTGIQDALIIGAGPIGLGALLVLQAMGAQQTHCSEIKPYRMQKAIEFGATPFDPAQTRRFDLIIEASGSKPGRQKALEAVAPGGACVFLGESTDNWDVEENREVKLKDFFLIRSFYFPIADYAENERMLVANAASFRRLVDAEASLENLPELFAAFYRGENLKPMMVNG